MTEKVESRIFSIFCLNDLSSMVRNTINSRKARKKTLDISDNEDITMSSFRDLEKSKHRNCEYVD